MLSVEVLGELLDIWLIALHKISKGIATGIIATQPVVDHSAQQGRFGIKYLFIKRTFDSVEAA